MIFLLVPALLMLVGCGWISMDTDSTALHVATGALEVVLVDPLFPTEMITPSLDVTIASYQIVVSGPGETASLTLDATQTAGVFESLVPGEWTVTVHARNGADPPIVIASGATTATVLRERSTSTSVTVRPVAGQGTLELSLQWPSTALDVPSVVATITTASGESTDISSLFVLASEGGIDTAEYLGTRDSAYYLLSLSLNDGGVQVWGDVIGVRIIAGELSRGAYLLEESDLNGVDQGGSLEINVGADLSNPHEISMTGGRLEIGPAEDMTVTISVVSGYEPEAVEWYLNGTEVSGVTDSAITIGPSGIWVAGGSTYRLTAIVRDGETISSATAIFFVTATSGSDPGTFPVSEATPDDPYFDLQWHYNLIGMPGAWGFLFDPDFGSLFSGAVVAVLDTGYLPHPDLAPNIVTDGYDFISSTAMSNDGDGIDPDPTDAGNDPESPNWHGTHVAGTIAAVTDNSTGVAGVGWNQLTIMPLRVLGVGGGTSYDIMQAILYASGEPNDSGTVPTTTVSVINMSLGGSSYSQAVFDAIQAAVDKGITVVASAGNDGVSPVHYPAAYSNVIAVSSVGSDSGIAAYSSYGSAVEIAAPGGGGDGSVLSTWSTDTYVYMNGTSMAAPHVSAVAGLLYAFNSTLDQGLVRSILATTALDLGLPGRDEYYGFGLLQADAAMSYLAQYGVDSMPTMAPAQAVPLPSREEIWNRISSEMENNRSYLPNRVIVKLRSTQPDLMSPLDAQARADSIAMRNELEVITGTHPTIRAARLRPGQSVEDALALLFLDDEVEYAEPVYLYSPM